MRGIAHALLLAALAAGATVAPRAAHAVCGDGVLEPATEQCDDGNTLHHDGCSASCEVRYCVAPPPSDCVMARRGVLRIREKGLGEERTGTLKIDLSDFAEDAALADFGDPVFNLTRYDVCIYGEREDPYTYLIVERGLETCGPNEKSCWRVIKDGYRYADPERRASGITGIDFVAGGAGQGRIRISAKRTRKKPWMPLVTATLEDDTAAKVRIMTTDGRCFGAELPTVEQNGPDAFRATGAP